MRGTGLKVVVQFRTCAADLPLSTLLIRVPSNHVKRSLPRLALHEFEYLASLGDPVVT